MMHANRLPNAQVPAPKLFAGSFSSARSTSALLVLGLICSIALAGQTAQRIARAERDLQPALQDASQLGAALEASRNLLRERRPHVVESRIAAADSQAQRFHRIATSSARTDEQRAQMRSWDHAFFQYYVQARRAAAGLSMSAEPFGSSAEDATFGYLTLRDRLGRGIQEREQALDASRPATAPVELAAWLAMAMLCTAALLRRTPVARHDWPVAASATARQETGYVPVPANDGPVTLHLHDAVERLARKRLAAAVAAARVAKRNNERQIEIAKTWNMPALAIVPATSEPVIPVAGMDVYEDDQSADEPRSGGLMLVTA